jgi:hypothetical protein
MAIQNIDAEIIVIDNNLIDDSCAMMQKTFFRIYNSSGHDHAGFPASTT